MILEREGDSFRKELISFSSVFSIFVSCSFSHSGSSSFRHFFETMILFIMCDWLNDVLRSCVLVASSHFVAFALFRFIFIISDLFKEIIQIISPAMNMWNRVSVSDTLSSCYPKNHYPSHSNIKWILDQVMKSNVLTYFSHFFDDNSWSLSKIIN